VRCLDDFFAILILVSLIWGLILSVGFNIISYKHRWVQPIYNFFAN
jgi:hypothetical protein